VEEPAIIRSEQKAPFEGVEPIMRYGSSSPEKFFNVDLHQIGAQITNEIRVEEMGLVEDRSSFLEFCQIEKRCSIE
jgi:hypothetical protein